MLEKFAKLDDCNTRRYGVCGRDDFVRSGFSG